MASGITFLSDNLSGESVNIVFTADTGSTITNFGDVSIPASLVTDYFYGEYTIYVYRYDASYRYVIDKPIPSPTPTVTVTPTVTITPTLTSTPQATVTPTLTSTPQSTVTPTLTTRPIVTGKPSPLVLDSE